MNSAADIRILEPLPYLRAILDYLKSENADIWNWFNKNRAPNSHVESVRLELLKSTYRIERSAQAQLYDLADQVMSKLALNLPITFYQSQRSAALNASIVFIPGELHLVLDGPVISTLGEFELRAMLGHELAHYIFYSGWDGEYRIAREILTALANDAAAESAHVATARLFSLYLEIFCDRGAYLVTDDLSAVICTLVKLETGIKEVSAESYARQAEEIFGSADVKTAGVTHPESFIRARAVKLWADQCDRANGEIERMIQGSPSLDELDLLGQRSVANLTRRLINEFLNAPWIQTERVLAHARQFFDDYALPSPGAEDTLLVGNLVTTDKSLLDYYCYVLLDFVATDRDLDEAPLARALLLTERLGLRERFSELASKELGLRKKQWEKVEREAVDIVAKADQFVPEP